MLEMFPQYFQRTNALYATVFHYNQCKSETVFTIIKVQNSGLFRIWRARVFQQLKQLCVKVW